MHLPARSTRWGIASSLAFAMAVGTGALPHASASSAAGASCAAKKPTRLVAQVIRTVGHDPDAFTQGLDVAGNTLYESDGGYTESTVRSMNAKTGVEFARIDLASQFFAEGLTVANGRLIQLTWNEHTALLRNPATLAQTGTFTFTGEGWGLETLSKTRLLMSDGSSNLTERDATTFRQLKKWRVTRVGGAADLLNELDFDGRHIWANRWLTNEILRIDPRCHTVTGVVDVTALRQRAEEIAAQEYRQIDVPNGIAHIPGTSRFWVTGKYWPVMFEVQMRAAT